MMPLQRARSAEKQAGNKSSNGPPRAQSKASGRRRVFCDVGHTLVAGDMLVSRKGHGPVGRESGWHRAFESLKHVPDRTLFLSGAFSFPRQRKGWKKS